MNIRTLDTAAVYREMAAAAKERRDDIYRYKLMAPFQGKWDCYHIPLKAARPGGYDIIMANNMMGLLAPQKVDETYLSQIDKIASPSLINACREAIVATLRRFEDKGIELKNRDYLYSIFLADPDNAYTIMNEGYCGDGGIPGYIMGWLIPTDENIKRLPAALAHETDHNVRYQFIKWTNDVNLGEMLVSEGLAENMATSMFGEEFLGPWVSKTDKELMPLIKEIIRDGLEVQSLENITAYLYGDEMARMQQYPEAGLPYCAGYATGYYLIKYYLKKTGKSIEEATILPSGKILRDACGFWDEPTF